MKLSYVVDMSTTPPGKPASVVQPLAKPVQVTAEECKDPAAIARLINELQTGVDGATLLARSSPFQSCGIFTNITFGTGGTKVVLQHGLGRLVGWFVVDWHGAATVTAPSLVSDQDDAAPVTSTQLLALRSYAAGVGDILVF